MTALSSGHKCDIDPETFADTLGQIYKDPAYLNHSEYVTAALEQIPKIDLQELKTAINSLANCKSDNEDGVVVECLKTALDDFLILLLEEYNSVLANFEPDPKRLEICFQMVFKSEMRKVSELTTHCNFRFVL